MKIDSRWKNPCLYQHIDKVSASLSHVGLLVNNAVSILTKEEFEQYYAGPELSSIPQMYVRTNYVWCVPDIENSIVLCCKYKQPRNEFDIYYRTLDSWKEFDMVKL